MKIAFRLVIILICICALIPLGLQAAEKQKVDEIIVCGWDEVYILDVSRIDNPVKVWGWKAKECSTIPEHVRNRFGTTDECKPVVGGRKILITSSGGGVALIDRKTKKVIFYGAVDNAHSADILPGGMVAVAGSDEGDERGNCLTLFDLRKSDKPVWNGRLFSGHGTVWDNTRQVLWALSDTEIEEYKLENWNTASRSLKKIAAYKMPEPGGHDLYAVPESSKLSVSTYAHCWTFDRDTHKFAPHPDIHKLGSVKSIDLNPVTGQLAYIEAGPEGWWSDTIRFLHPDAKINRTKEIIYKARWCR